ncbi:MAG: tRNA (adenosine(37)-N6)-threonylcarbamoyltransferase complex dimerization subunit type 1 TsaB [Truepera sp.]|nr:tRNA (adenosine(37)-N6)-threonylcarbamoyltransferase complex dimerization subunit type 1 TsaB [Truepera sp.]
MSCYLGFDTATPYLALALWSPEGVQVSLLERVERDHAKRLLPELARLMAQAGLERRQLRGIAVGIGPGSYTGLRVGLATAQGLARGLAIPVQGVPTLEAMAAGVLSADLPEAIVALDARRDNVYAARYRQTETGITVIDELGKVSRAELQACYPHFPYCENVPPDPGYLAEQAGRRRAPPQALYW